MKRENFNRYENDQKHTKKNKEKRLRSPVSKGSRRTQDKENLQRAIDHYKISGEYYED